MLSDEAVLIETTVLVDFLRGTDEASDFLDAVRRDTALVCSVVTQAELIVGANSRAQLRAIDQLMSRFQIEQITAHDSARSLSWLKKYYHSHGIGYHDCLLAAVARRLHLAVATLNEKHFRVIPGLRVYRPY